MSETIINDYLGKLSLKLSDSYSIEKHILERGTWERYVIEYLNYFVKPGFSCVDVGANAGFHTLLLADKAGAAGRVYAFEPSTLTFPRLVDNINLNPDLKPRIVPEKLGLSDRPDRLKLFQSGELLGNAYMGPDFNEKLWNTGGPDEFELCLVMKLDDYLEGRAVDLLKIDVEGMELEVLRGAERILAEHKPIVIFETLVKDFDPGKIQAAELLLRKLDYLLFTLHPKLRKLVPVTFPNLAPDTLALHRSRLLQYAEVCYNAAQYSFAPLPAAAGWSEPTMTIVGYACGLFMVELHHWNGEESTVSDAEYDGDCLSFKAAAGNTEAAFSLSFSEVLASSPDIDTSAELRGQMYVDCTPYQVAAVRTGGRLFNSSAAV